jgi:hypothetical protein
MTAKSLHKPFNKLDIPWMHLIWEKHYSNGRLLIQEKWGSLWWRDFLKLLPIYKSIASVTHYGGSSCFLWLDHWHRPSLQQIFPELFSFARNPNISVQSARLAVLLQSLFHLPLSVDAFDQYQALTSSVKTVRDTQDADIWTYVWGSSLLCSGNAYKHLIGHRQIHPVFRWLWKSS